MSTLTAQITGFVAGDNLQVRRTVTDLPDAIAMAWLTVKRRADQPDTEAAVQKAITVTDVPGTGQVVAAGGPGVDGDLRFDLIPTDTGTLGSQEYVYDIQIKLSGGEVYTIEKGALQLTDGVTIATS